MASFRILLALGALTMIATAVRAEKPTEVTTPEIYTSPTGETLLFRRYLPAGIAPGRKLPIVLFFHGAGERGTNNTSQLVHGIASLIQYGGISNDPAILIVPQCPAGRQWVDTPWSLPRHTMPETPSAPMRLALELFGQQCATLPVDPQRIYVTGISMGGYGTWDAIQRYPARFAAALIVCGGGDTAESPRLRHLPIWIFHGEMDGAVPVCRGRDMYAALQALGAPVQYREYPGQGHGVWGVTYADKSVLAWFFAQRKPEN